MNRFLSTRERLLFVLEVREFFFHRRSLHFVPLLLVGIFLMAWIYPVGSPFAPVIIVVIAGLEPQFNNALFRSPREFEAMSLFPVSWKRIILVKNLATIALTLLLLSLVSMALLYFSPEAMTSMRLRQAFLYFSTVLFPLIHFGNTQSVRQPRREAGMRTEDLIEAIWMMVNLLLVSIPSYTFISMIKIPILCVVYSYATAIYWYRVSIPKTGRQIEKEQMVICSSR